MRFDKDPAVVSRRTAAKAERFFGVGVVIATTAR